MNVMKVINLIKVLNVINIMKPIDFMKVMNRDHLIVEFFKLVRYHECKGVVGSIVIETFYQNHFVILGIFDTIRLTIWSIFFNLAYWNPVFPCLSLAARSNCN